MLDVVSWPVNSVEYYIFIKMYLETALGFWELGDLH